MERPVPEDTQQLNLDEAMFILQKMIHSVGEIRRTLDWLAAGEEDKQLDMLHGCMLTCCMNLEATLWGLQKKYKEPLQTEIS